MENTYDPNSTLSDKVLLCEDCSNPFIFSVGEQKFFLSKGLAMPKRCHKCRLLRKITLQEERK